MVLKNSKIQQKRQDSGLVNYKELSFQVKKPSVDSRKVSGYFAVFGNKDSDSDIIIKGAFAKSIADRGPESSAGNKIAFLWQHDMKEPLGRITMLKEDDFGLYFECDLDDIDTANRALTQMESGTLDKFSIGYQYVWDKMEYDQDQDAFICKELNLFEGSVVTMAANDATYYAGLKSEDLVSEIDELHEETERFFRSLPQQKQFELRQIMTKQLALAKSEPLEKLKQALKEKQAAKPVSRWAKLAELSNN